MGPFLLIDKSALQGFSEIEIDILHRCYSVIICPILIHEIQANLIKHPDDLELSKSKVSHLAKKASGFGSFTIDRHERLLQASLFGAPIELRAQIPRFDGEEVISADGTKGVVFTETEEETTLKKWSLGVFEEAALEMAQKHVDDVSSYGLEKSSKDYAKLYPENTNFKSLEEIKRFHDHPDFEGTFGSWSLIESQLNGFNFANEQKTQINERWKKLGCPSFIEFAKYAHYCHRLNTVFWIGVTANLIPLSKEAKSIVDYQYFYYLPFVNIFCSADKFHRDCSKHFLRDDQEFIWRDDLKTDLKNIASCLESMTPDEKRYYVRHFGSRPPPLLESITVSLWNRYCGHWHENSGNRANDISEKEQKKIIEHVNSLLKARR